MYESCHTSIHQLCVTCNYNSLLKKHHWKFFNLSFRFNGSFQFTQITCIHHWYLYSHICSSHFWEVPIGTCQYKKKSDKMFFIKKLCIIEVGFTLDLEVKTSTWQLSVLVFGHKFVVCLYKLFNPCDLWCWCDDVAYSDCKLSAFNNFGPFT